MKFSCRNPQCKQNGTEIEVHATQLIPIDLDVKLYAAEQKPFFYTIPPVFCGYCGLQAWQGEWKE